MNNPLEVFKKIPPQYRFGIIALSAGGVGYVAYKRREAAAAVDTSMADAEVDPNGQYAGLNNGGASAYTPIVVTGSSPAVPEDSSFGINQVLSSYLEGISKTQDRFASWADRLLDSSDNANQRVVDIATAGSSMQSPAEVVVNPITIPVNPVTIPTAAPAPTASTPSHNPAYNKQNSKTGQWYKEAKATSKFKDSNGKTVNKGDTYNLYENGRRVKD